jgi:hypothetical protein
METVPSSRESLFERLIPHFGSGVLGEWKWRNLDENRRWGSELADRDSCWFGYRRFSVHPCI